MLSTLVSLISHISSKAPLENASKRKRFDDFKTMLSLNDKDEDQEEGLPLKPTQNDFVNEEEEERIPRARSKRARRAPKAVYDNDFEAHEIQNVRVDSFLQHFHRRVFVLLHLEEKSVEFSRRGGLLSFTFTSSSRCFCRPSSCYCLVLLFLFLRMMILIFKHVKQCEY